MKNQRFWSLTDIHDGGGRHVAHGRGEEEQRVEPLTRIHLRLRPPSVVAEQDVEDGQTAELTQEHTHGLDTQSGTCKKKKEEEEDRSSLFRPVISLNRLS